MALLSSNRRSKSPFRGFRPRCEPLENRLAPAIITVTGIGDTIAADGFVTLREALTASNTDAVSGDAPAGSGFDVIYFNIAGAPGTIHTIKPLSALPTITDQVYIDGYSQLGSSANTLAHGTNAFLSIELDGTNAGFHPGLAISAGSCTVRGLVINEFKNEGIIIYDKGGNVIEGNFLGTDATGNLDRGNGVAGVALLSSNNTVGGTDPADRNLISGNGFAGITIVNPGASGNVVWGNLIGTDDTGALPLGNFGEGVRLFNVVGNTVGGTSPGTSNVIAFNNGAGVQVSNDAGTGIAVLGNAIFGNGGLGVDLKGDGVTGNDETDADTGPNGLQNFPIITSAITASGTTVHGVLRSTPNTTFRVELFSSDAADLSGFGEGQNYLGFNDVVTNGQGTATFQFNAVGIVSINKYVAMTATDVVTNSTSELSRAIRVMAPRPFAVAGAPGVVHLYSNNGTSLGSFTPFPGYFGAISVAIGDVNADGYADLFVGAISGNPHVKIYDGAAIDGGAFLNSPETHMVAEGFPYAVNFNVGVNIAAGDVNGDGYADFVTGAVPGNPHVKVYDGKQLVASGVIPTLNDASHLAEGFVYGVNFNVGANVAARDVNGDGFADVITGASAGNPHTKVFDGKQIITNKTLPTGQAPSVLAEFFPYGLNFNVGTFVTVGDYNQDGYADVITGASVGNPEVRVFSGKDIATNTFNSNTSLLDTFYAFETGQNIGVSVAAGDFTNDGKTDVLVGTRSGTPQVRVFQNNLPSPATILKGVDIDGFNGPLYVAA